MTKRELIIISVERDLEFSLEELCQLCEITPDFIQELIDYGTIEANQYPLAALRFNSEHVRLIRRILHLEQDLQVNLPGALLAIDLKNEIERMQMEIDILKKYWASAQHYSRS